MRQNENNVRYTTMLVAVGADISGKHNKSYRVQESLLYGLEPLFCYSFFNRSSHFESHCGHIHSPRYTSPIRMSFKNFFFMSVSTIR